MLLLSVAVLLRAVKDAKRGDDVALAWLRDGAEPWREVAGWQQRHIEELLRRRGRIHMPRTASYCKVG